MGESVHRHGSKNGISKVLEDKDEKCKSEVLALQSNQIFCDRDAYSARICSLRKKADSLCLTVERGDVDGIIELLQWGANVNVPTANGLIVLGRAAQIGNAKIVSVLLDADKFHKPCVDDDCEIEITCTSSTANDSVKYYDDGLTGDCPSPSRHKCCSPSIDCETCTCSDEVWGLDTSDTNTGQFSDWETNCCGRDASESKDECSEIEHEPTYNNASCTFTVQQYQNNNVPYVYECPEGVDDTGDSSGPVLSSTEDSDSAAADRRHHHYSHRHSSLLLHRTLGRGRANIVSSDSEFETEDRRRRRHAKSNYRNYKHYREHTRNKVVNTQTSSSWLAPLPADCLSIGVSTHSLQYKCNINQYDRYGRTSLHYAIQHGHTHIAKMLIEAGAIVDTPDHTQHMTALHVSAQIGLSDVVSMLLDAGAKVNSKMTDKSSPLHIAASWGYTSIVKTLLGKGAKIDSLDSSDRSPIFLAVSRNHYKVVEVLLKSGASVNLEEIHGYTPLCECIWNKDARMVQILLNAGAKVKQSHYLLHYSIVHRQYRIVKLLLGARCIVNLRDDKGESPLSIAVRTCQPEIIKLLLSHGAKVNYPNSITGATPLHEAVEGTRDAQFDDFLIIFKLLQSYGAKLNISAATAGDTPLYRAVFLKKSRAAELLLLEGCDVDIGHPMSSPDYLRLALQQSNVSLARLLVLSGLNIQKLKWLHCSNPHCCPIYRHFAAVKSNPFMLLDLCRIVIRKQFGERVRRGIHTLHLPTPVKKFLLFEDLPYNCLNIKCKQLSMCRHVQTLKINQDGAGME